MNYKILFAIVAIGYFSQVNAQSACSVSDAFLTPGFYNVSQQAATGFCKEWVVGPVTAIKRILVQLPQVNVNCALGDKLVIMSDDRSKVFFDFCTPVANQYQNSVLGEGKYVFIRLSTLTSRLLSLYFAFYTIDLSTSTTIVPTTSQTTTQTIPSSRACGVPFHKPNELLRIVGGIEAVPHSWPWQAFLTDGSSMCGGSLINNEYILTAAHCLDGVRVSNLRVTLGVHNIVSRESASVVRTVSKAIKHELYIGQRNSWDNDIALLKLSTPVAFTNEILPICLPQQGNNLAVLGSSPYVTGWGRVNGFGQTSDVLKQTALTVQRQSLCGSTLTDNMICAGRTGPTRDSCDGDSGGPKFMKINNSYYQTGIVSWGSAECSGDGVYTKLSNYIDWIKNKIATN